MLLIRHTWIWLLIFTFFSSLFLSLFLWKKHTHPSIKFIGVFVCFSHIYCCYHFRWIENELRINIYKKFRQKFDFFDARFRSVCLSNNCTSSSSDQLTMWKWLLWNGWFYWWWYELKLITMVISFLQSIQLYFFSIRHHYNHHHQSFFMDNNNYPTVRRKEKKNKI